MAIGHFEKLREFVDAEAEAQAEEAVRCYKRNAGPQAEATGTTLIDLAIRDETFGCGGRSVVTLGKRDRQRELPWNRLNSGSPIVLHEQQSTQKTGWRGVVTDRDRQTITIALSDSPEPVNDRPLFRLDLSADEIARDRQRVALQRFIEADRGRMAVWKRLLLEEEPPLFQPPPVWNPIGKLDDSQLAAVTHTLSAEHLAVIHGPPGTGKTTTVIELIRQAIRRGDKVLACAPSNLAVDNLLERLVQAGEKVIRLGHPARVLPQLRDHTLDLLMESHPDLELAREWTKEAWTLRRQASRFTRTAPAPGARQDARAEAKRLLKDARETETRLVDYLIDSTAVVCATLTGINDDLLGDRQFDLVVIDEAAQATEPSCLIPLSRAKRLVLAGDHYQLPPTILSTAAMRGGFHVSLMERLVNRWGDVVARRLSTQYRMHSQIMSFSSNEFYDGQLTAATAVRRQVLADLPYVESTPMTQSAVQFFDTAGSDCTESTEADGESRENTGEAEHVARQVTTLTETGLLPSQISVITPYAAQARLLRTLINDAAVEIDTVDGFQGRENEAVIISLVRSNSKGEVGFLTDTRRMNVALTRARRKLIVFGDSATLSNHEFYLRMLNYFETINSYGTVWELPNLTLD